MTRYIILAYFFAFLCSPPHSVGQEITHTYYAQSDKYYWSTDFATVRPNQRGAAIYFWEKNWKYFRDTALAKGYIKAYRLLEAEPDSSGNFNFILMTAYADSTAYAQAESNFEPIMKRLRPTGPLMPAQTKRSDIFQKVIWKDATTVFSAQVKPEPKVNIPDDTYNTQRLLQINTDIWLPFSAAYATNNADQYLALHAPDFIRSSGGKYSSMKTLAEYGQSVRLGFEKRRDQSQKVEISFTFFERITGEVTASERGIYRFTAFSKNGEKEHFFGKFHVFHRKINGTWKIAVDYDSDEEHSIGEDEYSSGWPIDKLRE